MKATDRRIVQSPLYHGADEEVPYTLTTTPWGSSPSNVSVKVYDENGDDVTSTVCSGSATVSGDVITLPTIKSLTPDETYRLEIKFTISGATMETWAELRGQE